ncbi:hypothetical protein P4B35_22300 [Pontiellaceae bacterium B12227]|nr:hypothetical protein [Pontiellaceae bacterium B12227]
MTIPVLQQLADVKAYKNGERSTPWPQSLNIVTALGELPPAKEGDSALQTVLARNAFLLQRINKYEDQLENRSMLTKSLLGPGQEVLTRYLGAGNEKAYMGKGRWLYYRPDVDYIIGPAFLDKQILKRKSSQGTTTNPTPQPDPVAAIIYFQQQLAAHGVELVLVPVPAKPGIVPGPLTRKPQPLPIQNPSFDEFKQRVTAAGVALFDPAPVLAHQFKTTQVEPYLITDTHWTPASMDAVAKGLAAFLQDRYSLSASETPLYSRTPVELTAAGDIAAMLKLPEDSTLFADQTVTLQQVHGASDADAEVLLLGDSFVNIYSAKELGWGEHSGLADQLQFHLQWPVDRLARNDNAAYATREMLRDEWARGQNPLVGKKVVVWEFAARELASGDWRIFDLQPAESEKEQKSSLLVPEAGEEIIVDATVLAVSEIPIPGSVPYRDHVCMVHFKHVDEIHETVAFMRSMQDNKLARVAEWKMGSQVKVQLRSWNDVFDEYGSINQSELDGLPLLDAYGWAEPVDQAGMAIKKIPAGLIAYAAGLLLIILFVCRTAKDMFLRIGIGLIGLFWIAGGLVIWGGETPQAQEEPVVVAPEKNEPLPIVEASKQTFKEYCSSTAAQAEKNGKMVVRGLDDWLFLSSELRHMGINQFWGEHAAEVSKASNPDYADPLPGILDFHAQLKEAGVELWIVPVPPKVAIYPDKLAAGYTADTRLDSSHQEFYELLKKEGVEVVDMTPKFLTERAAGNEALYCRQDSHWAERGMELLADELFSRIEMLPWYGETPKATFRKAAIEQQISGDLWQMLSGKRPPKERIQLTSVTSESTGQPIESDPSSPILLLGDSHTLVFHGGGDMHAVGAGLVDQLALRTGVSCDLIGVKGSGAGPSRRTLYGKSRKDPEYLSGKKLVIWCFTAREFTESTGIAWRKIPIK